MKFWLGARWDKICRSAGILDCVQGQACAEDSQGDPKFNTAGGGTKFCLWAGQDKI